MALVAGLLRPAAAGAQPPRPGESIVVAVTLNAEAKGDFIVIAGSDGDLLVSRADLEKMGLRDPAGSWSFTIDGLEHLSLKGIRHLAFRLDEHAAALKIAAAPRLLRSQAVDLAARGRRVGSRPVNASAFFNYGLEYRASDDGHRTGTLTGEAGLQAGGWLLLADGRVRGESGRDPSALRYLTSVVRDDRERLRRFTLGDLTASSVPGGGGVILGGVGLVKKYDIDPSFPWNPVFGYAGMTPLGGELEISIDGRPQYTERISAGEYEIRNLWQRFAGHRLVEVALRDAFGGVTRYARGFYFSDMLLGAGLQDYGYHLGFRREQYGRESFEYGGLSFLGYHRFGVSDGLTVGLGAEAEEGLANAGPDIAFTLGEFGQVRVLGRGSGGDDARGYAGAVSYGYNGRLFDLMLKAQGQTREYDAVGRVFTDRSYRTSYAATASCALPGRATLSVGYFLDRSFAGEERRTAQASVMRDLTRRLKILATVRDVRDGDSETKLAVDLIWAAGRDGASARYERSAGADATTLKAYRTVQEAEGFGYRASASREAFRDAADLDLQYNGRHGVYRLGVEGYDRDGGEDGGSLELFAGGALTAVGGVVGASRPVRDAFALVSVDALPGVRVYRNNQEVGRTDASGRVLLPRLDAYHANEIRINERDVPLEYRIPSLSLFVSPAYRQGALLEFDVRRFQAVSGHLLITAPGGARPLEFRTAVVRVDGREVSFPTGRGGEFYLENLAPGSYEATVAWNGTGARCVIRVPESQETIVEVGEIICTVP